MTRRVPARPALPRARSGSEPVAAPPRAGSGPVLPWVRVRLRSAPAPAVAFGLLVLLTSFLAAAFPRAVDGNETSALRRAVAEADPARTALWLTGTEPGFDVPADRRAEAFSPRVLAAAHRGVLAAVPPPLRVDAGQSAYGVRTGAVLWAHDRWLPRPEELPPQFALAARSGLAEHAEVAAGRLPSPATRVVDGTLHLDAAATTQTAAKLGVRVGSVVHIGGEPERPAYAVRVTGLVRPLQPEGSYWAAEKLLRTPGLTITPSTPAKRYWQAGLLLSPGAAPALLGTEGKPEPYWTAVPDPGRFRAEESAELADRVAWLESGPGLIALREAAGENAVLATDLDAVLAAQRDVVGAIGPVVAVAAVSTGTVAAVAMVLTAGLHAARRRPELVLLRARGGSLGGIGGRLLAESAVVAVPGAAVGLLAAVRLVDGGRPAVSVLAAAAVAGLGCVVLPLRALPPLRRAEAAPGRADAAGGGTGRRRIVAEVTLLALAAGAVAALRRRGTQDSGDLLVSAAPVLVGLIAALVLVRLYPLPLWLAARPVACSRGLLGFLGLARAGRAPRAGVPVLLVLMVALTTAAFGGAVLASVADARELAALEAVGADARVAAADRTKPLPAGLADTVARVPGVEAAAPVRIEESVTLPGDARTSPALVTLAPGSYSPLAAAYPGGGGLDAVAAKGPVREGGAVPVVASPRVAEVLGRGPQQVVTAFGPLRVRVAAVHARTPAVPTGEFLLVDAAALPREHASTAPAAPTVPTVLLVTGEGADAEALRSAARSADPGLRVVLRAEQRAAFADAPVQQGAERIFAAAVAAGVAYAVLALLVSALHSAPERTALLARLRTMGLTRRQGRTLLLVESLPVAVPAALGGLLVGRAAVELLAPGVPLARLAFATGAPVVPIGGVPLRADGWTMLVPAAGVLLLSAAAALVQAWWAGRRGPAAELRAGEQGES